MKYLLFCCLCLFSFTCENIIENPGKNKTIDGIKPVYTQLTSENIFTTTPKVFNSLQNFLIFRDYILVIERNLGIHLIDNNDPESPINVAFWNIPGIRNLSISDNTLFVPIADKLVTIDVTDIDNIQIISVTENLFQNADQNLFPDNYAGSFECVDESKGVVIDWAVATLFDPQCWR